jgi:hypothetical protein
MGRVPSMLIRNLGRQGLLVTAVPKRLNGSVTLGRVGSHLSYTFLLLLIPPLLPDCH